MYLFTVVIRHYVISKQSTSPMNEPLIVLISASPHRWKDASFPCRQMQMWSWSAVLITASICCAFSQHFSLFFVCFLLWISPLLCVIFPIHTFHESLKALRSRLKVFLQTACLFMVFSSINGLLSPDTVGINVCCIRIWLLNRNTAINITLCRHLSSQEVLSWSDSEFSSWIQVDTTDRKHSCTVLQDSLELLLLFTEETITLLTLLFSSNNRSYGLLCQLYDQFMCWKKKKKSLFYVLLLQFNKNACRFIGPCNIHTKYMILFFKSKLLGRWSGSTFLFSE